MRLRAARKAIEAHCMEVAGLRSKVINIVQRPFKSLPLAIDIPRLASNFEVRRGAKALWVPPSAPVHETLRSLLLALITYLDGAQAAERFQAEYGRYVQYQDVPKALERFLEEIVGGDRSRTVQLLKAANQAIIGPAVVELKITLGPAYLTKDVRGWWRVEVQLGGPDQVEVVTRKRDVCVRGNFLLEWTLTVLFGAPPAPSPLSPQDIRFELTLVRYGPPLRAPSEASRLSALRAILARYAPPHVLEAADKATDWSADQPPSYLSPSFPLPPPAPLISSASASNLIIPPSASAPVASAPPSPVAAPIAASRSTPSIVSTEPATSSSPASSTSASTSGSTAVSTASTASSSSFSPAPAPAAPASPTSPRVWVQPLYRAQSSDAVLRARSKSEAEGIVRVITYSNGDAYDGQIAPDGRREGRGTYTTAQGDVYVGTYVAGQRHGNGVYTRKDGSRYEGEFKDGCTHGQGVYVFEDGSIYRGQFAHDEFHGRGRWSSVKGDFYEGEYRKGKRHGHGVLMVQGTRYDGEWEDDQRCGHGRLELSNGDWYEGGFAAGKFHGKGHYHFAATNATVAATFRNGKPVSAKGGTV